MNFEPRINIQHTIERYKSNRERIRARARTERKIKQVTGAPIVYRSLTNRAISDKVIYLEQKCESLENRIIALEQNAQQRPSSRTHKDEQKGNVSDSESGFGIISLERDQISHDHTDGRSCKTSSPPSRESDLYKNPETSEQRLLKVTNLIYDLEIPVRNLDRFHENIKSKLEEARRLA